MSNLLFHQQYPKRIESPLTMYPQLKVAIRTVRGRWFCQHKADRG